MNAAATTPTLAQQRAMSFVAQRIKDAGTDAFHAGYIHGLIQAFLMAGAITVKQGCKLETEQEKTSCAAANRRAIEHAPRRAVGGVA